MKKRNIRRIVILFIVWLLGVLFILRPHAETISGDIHYRLAWYTDGITYNDSGWTVTTASGYTVHVEAGYITSYSAELVYCPHNHSFLGLFGSIFSMLTAHAGHTGETSPAKVNASVIESLTKPTETDWDTVTVAEPAYCQGHYLIGRADNTTQAMPNDVNMNRMSIYIRGTYRSATTESATPFLIQTNLGNGTLQELHMPDKPNAVHAEIGAQPVEITIRRHLATLFDQIDFDHMGTQEQAKALLNQLIAQTEIVVTGGTAH
jgi:hypothetical protein